MLLRETVMVEAHYEWRLVALSIGIAIASSYTALDLAGRIAHAQGKTRTAWLAAGATAMGLGIWAMHYIGMQAYRLPMPVFYDLPLVGVSLLAAIAASAVALYIVSGRELTPVHGVVGSLTMGTGIATMHYVGMHAMRVAAHRSYSLGLVALSITLAVVVSGVALFLAFRLREDDENTFWSRPLSAVVMGFAVASMHYTGMAAVCFHDAGGMTGGGMTSVSRLGIFCIATVTFTVLALSLVGSVANSRFAQQQKLLDAEQAHRLTMEKEIAARIQAEAHVRQAYEHMGELVAERTVELQESQAKWRGLIEALPQLIWMAGSQGELTFVSDECMRYTGCPPGGLLGYAFMDYVHPDDQERVLSSTAAGISAQTSYRHEVRLRSKEGVYRWFQSRGQPVYEVEGEAPTQWVGYSTDVDDQKRSNELLEAAVTQRTVALEEARARAESAMRAKSDFLAVMSHEIRTPMNGVIGMAHLMMDTPLNQTQRGYLDTIRSSGQALLTIINDILDFSKIEAGKMEIYDEAFELRTVLRECMELIAPGASTKGLDLRLAVTEALPERMTGDAGRVRQILLNLLSNATKFTPAGMVSLTVALEGTGEGRRVRFEVRDSGIGLTDEQIGNLFQAFTQADHSTTRRFGGTGLGLSIARRLVELMGGEIGVTSQMGEGSTFWFELPLKEVAEASVPAPITRVPTQGKGGTFKDMFAGSRLRVLIADDVVTNQMVARGLLAELGLLADAVSNGAEAIAVLDTIRYDLVLMDVHMPEMDGLEATRQIRGRDWDQAAVPRRLPIIALTASAMPGDRAKFLEAGMDDFISKPIMPASLVEVLRKWLPREEQAASMAPEQTSGPTVVPDNEEALCVFDRAGLLSRVMDDEALAQAVLAGFALDMPTHVKALGGLVKAGSVAEAADLAHRIRGAAATVGGEAVRAVAEAMETAGRAGDLVQLTELAGPLEVEFGRLMEALAAERVGLLAA